ncbi:MAG: hypothetical protein IKG30_00760 [Clostridiales bacterium]|nr:hypothetical protein [Clostridiales bacterium]
MKTKKIVSVVLCAAFISGIAGCTENKKPTNESRIYSVVNEYGEALTDLDGDAVLGLTDWKKDSTYYMAAKDLFDITGYDIEMQRCYREIASTIELDYELTDIEVKDNKASLELSYELVDWESVFDGPNGYSDYDEVITALKNTSGSVSIKGKISFVLEDGEWKISRITSLADVLGFLFDYPYITFVGPAEPDPTGTGPSDTTPTGIDPTGTVFADSYDKAIIAYVDILKENTDDIRAVEELYDIDTVGLYDIDRNGIPELFFISVSSDNYSSVLHVYEYREYKGEADEVITVPNILARGQASGNFMIYVTDKELIATHTYGDESTYHIESEIFTTAVNSDEGNYKWDLVAKYERVTSTDYDPFSNTETTECRYTLHGYTIEEIQYMEGMKDLTGRTVMVLGRKFNLTSQDPEFGLLSKPVCSIFNCGKAIEYLSSLV